ncbi:hypothetical protein VNO77_05602 [Canavalia gladiata]|uniref:Uncharacterized protein n=1 Tax=Canavalia gladiata TaxID=3824 RepID=A0AAN9N588_CANGL
MPCHVSIFLIFIIIIIIISRVFFLSPSNSTSLSFLSVDKRFKAEKFLLRKGIYGVRSEQRAIRCYDAVGKGSVSWKLNGLNG